MSISKALFHLYTDIPEEKPWTNLEAPTTSYEGEGEPQPFPNYARTNSPELLQLWGHTRRSWRSSSTTP